MFHIQEHNRRSDFLWGAIVGGSIAAVTAMLFNTRAGKQIQDKISEKYDELEDGIKNFSNSAAKTAEDAVDTASKKIGNLGNKGKKEE